MTGQECKELRIKYGISEENLARIAGIAKKSVINFENGLVRTRKDTIDLIESAFNSDTMISLKNEHILTPEEVTALRVKKGWKIKSIATFAEIDGYTWKAYERRLRTTTHGTILKISKTVMSVPSLEDYIKRVTEELKSVFEWLKNKKGAEALNIISTHTGVVPLIIKDILMDGKTYYQGKSHQFRTYQLIEKGLADIISIYEISV